MTAVNPGAVLREDALPALGMTQTELAERLGVSRLTVSELLLEKRGLSAEMAVRLGKLLNTAPQNWLRMQELPGKPVAALGARGAYTPAPAREAGLGIGQWWAPVETVLSPAVADGAQREVNLDNAALRAFVMTLDYRNRLFCLDAAQTDGR